MFEELKYLLYFLHLEIAKLFWKLNIGYHCCISNMKRVVYYLLMLGGLS